MSRGRRLVRLVFVLAALYTSLCVMLYLARNRIIFPISGGLHGEPARFGFAGGRVVTIPTADGARLAGWYVPSAGPSPAPVLVWFPGNAETIAGIAPVIRQLRPDGWALLALDYRGYGASTGRAGVAAAEGDVAAVWSWLEAEPGLDTSRVVVYGRSIGSGSAFAFASRRPVAGLIVESAFTSLGAVARIHYRLFPPWLAGGGFNNMARMDSLRCPVLVIHGERDGIIPAAMGRALAERAGERAELLIVPGADHNDVYDMGGEEYERRIRAFLDRASTH